MDHPNILIIMCDQLNASVLSRYGGPVPTPNIDRLASEGALFNQATCPTPFCSPSRASLITGLYPHSHGIVYNVNRREYPAIPSSSTEEGIKASDVTLENLLCRQGYETHHYGKLHLLDDDLPYFPDMFREHHEYAQRMSSIFHEVRKRPRNQWMEWYGWAMPVQVSAPLQEAVLTLGERWKGGPYDELIAKMGRLELPPDQTFDAQVADQTIASLRLPRDVPFMITCSLNYPHDPNVVPSPYYEMFPPEEIQLPANSDSREQRFENEWSRKIVADLGEAGLREFLRLYYAAVKLVDDQVGRVLDALDAAGQADNTIVIFTADHGDMAGGHGMVWKSTASFYEEVVRVPLILRYPAQVSPRQMDIAAGLTDLTPTLLDFVAHPIPDRCQGQSLAPYLRGECDETAAPAYTFCERVQPNRERSRKIASGTPGSFMARGRGWKYVRYADGEEFLYDLVNDPGETKNLAGDRSFDDRKTDLRGELADWLAATGYPDGKEFSQGA